MNSQIIHSFIYIRSYVRSFNLSPTQAQQTTINTIAYLRTCSIDHIRDAVLLARPEHVACKQSASTSRPERNTRTSH